MYSDQISRVRECIEGRRRADEQTLDAVAALAGRLERLKKAGPLFSGVCFSDAVGRFVREEAPAIG